MSNKIVFNGKQYGGGVDSVNGQTGVVVLGTDDVVESGGTSTVTQLLAALQDAIDAKPDASDIPTVVQSTGGSTTDVMSQKAVTDALASLSAAGIQFQTVDELPPTGQSNVIYLVPQSSATDPQDTYEEFVWLASAARFESLGFTNIDLSGYATLDDLADGLAGKVAVVDGMGLSSNDYTTADKTKLAGIPANAAANVQSDWAQTTTSADDYIKNKPTTMPNPNALTIQVAGATKATYTGASAAQVNVDAAGIGLGNVDNTSDANKPVSNLQQAAINAAVQNLVGSTQVTQIQQVASLPPTPDATVLYLVG